jgi:hypothetical protein
VAVVAQQEDSLVAVVPQERLLAVVGVAVPRSEVAGSDIRTWNGAGVRCGDRRYIGPRGSVHWTRQNR